MKFMFLLVCIICAVSWSFLSMIFVTGTIPFREAEKEAAAVALSAAAKPSHTVFSGERGVVDQLKDALKKEHSLYEEKMEILASKEAEIVKKEEVVEALIAQFHELEQKLDEKIVEVQSAEAANFKRLAAVYAKMDSANAATLLSKLDPERAATILSLIGERQAAAILNEAIVQGPNGIESAAEWSDIIRRMKSSETKRE